MAALFLPLGTLPHAHAQDAKNHAYNPIPLFVPCALLLAVLVAGCDSTDEIGIATFTGTVVNQANSPVAGALVTAIPSGEQATTSASGTFELSVEADSTGQTVTFQISAPNFDLAQETARAEVDGRVTLGTIELVPTNGGDGGDDPGNGGVDGGADEPSGPAASITLVGRSSEAIGVQSAGTDETATLTFVVLDAFGNPIDVEHAVDVTFSIANGPGGGEFIAPAVKQTNASGRVQTTVSSGTRAGTVQIIAMATNEEGGVLRSLPIVITITGGLPDGLHFSVVPLDLNFPGYTRFGLINPITAFVGDIYANPVQPGTAVYFTTNAGIIEGSGVTDELGRTTVQLVSAAPLTTGTPPAACPGSNSIGYAVVTASTSDLNQETIESFTPVLFSGDTQLPRDSLVAVNIDTTGLGDYRFFVADPFGHPLAPGTTTTVVADGVNVEAVGDVGVELGDYLCPGDGRTSFNFSAVQGDQVDVSGTPIPPELETLTITVRSPNGNVQLTAFAVGGGLLDIVVEEF